VTEGRIIALGQRGGLPGRHPARRAPLVLLALAVSHPQGAARDGVAKPDRLRLRPRRRSAAAQPDAGPRHPVHNFQDTRAFLGDTKDQDAASAPAARHPARRRLRHQPVPVRRHHRQPRSIASTIGRRWSWETLISWQKELRGVDGFVPWSSAHPCGRSTSKCWRPSRWTWCRAHQGGPRGAPPVPKALPDVEGPQGVDTSPSSRSRTVVPDAGANHRSRRGQRCPRPELSQQLQTHEAFLRAGGRRGRQYLPLNRRHLLPQSLVRTIEMLPKTVVPIGFVGVVVKLYGRGRP